MKRKVIKVNKRKKYTYKTTNITTRPKVKNRRIKQLKVILIFILLLIVCGAMLFGVGKAVSDYLVNSQQFKLRSVEVVASKNISRTEVLSLLPFREGNSMFKLWIEETENKILKAKPEIESVKINRGWQKVIVTWKERVPVGWVLKDGSKIGVDNFNKEFALRGSWSEVELPQLVAKNVVGRAKILKFMKALLHANKEFFLQSTQFGELSDKSIYFDLKNGTKIYWGTVNNFEISNKLNKLNKVFADAKSKYEAIEYVKLQFFDQGRIIIKPKIVPVIIEPLVTKKITVKHSGSKAR